GRAAGGGRPAGETTRGGPRRGRGPPGGGGPGGGAAPALRAPPPPTPAASAAAPATPTEAQARNIAAMQHLADTLAGDAQDCEKLAVDLKAFIAGNRAVLAQLMAAANRPADDAPTGATRAAAADAARQLQTAMATCAATSSVAAAMKDLPGP